MNLIAPLRTNAAEGNRMEGKRRIMNFLDVFSGVATTPLMMVARVDDVKLKPKTNQMTVKLTVPYPPPPEEEHDIQRAISSAYGVQDVQLQFKVIQEEKKKEKKAVIRGKAVSPEKVDKIKNIDEYYGKAVVEGEVFATDQRETKRGKILFKFDMTDKSGSITIKLMLTKEEAGEIEGRIKPGVCLRVKGDAKYDQYDKEVGMFAEDILEVPKEIKLDEAPEKRVELHLHTKMSAMDSVLEVEKAVERAAKWGHKAIAITDHGGVQAYPDAWDAGRANGIKIIYGVECYLIGDGSKIVNGPGNQAFNDAFVAFDIETTGLSPVTSEIIEIGAVKIENGMVTETFNELIDPKVRLSDFTTELTGITNEMVDGKPVLDEVLPRFLDFVGDLPVIAHNASFDCGFIQFACQKRKLDFKNTSIDTLEFSRAIFEELKKHKLDTIAKHLKIDMGSHHRACDDANTCAQIFMKLCERAKDKGVESIGALNETLCKFDYKKEKSYHTIILVKDQPGLKNLYQIISASHLEYFYKRPRVPKSLLQKFREGLIVGSACEAGELYRAMVDGKSHEELKEIASFYDYLEIQPLGNNRFMLDNGTVNDMEQLRQFNRNIIDLAKEMGKPYVATCDAHFLDPEDSIYRAIIMAGQKFSDADKQPPLYFRTTDEMLAEFDYLDEETRYNAVIKYPNQIADMIEEDMHPIPKQTYAPSIDGAEDDVRNISFATAKEIYGENLPPLVVERMNKELDSIIKNGFSVMYVIAQKLVWKSLEDGYLVGSRGSVGSSFVAFLMKITEVNSLCPHYICPNCKHVEFIEDGSVGCGFDLPDKNCPECGTKMHKDGHDIPFETFLGFNGDKDPDIDLNFSGEYQAEAHRYTGRIFGNDHVFKAGTISTLADKTAYGYVMNYLSERGIVTTNAERNRLTLGCAGVKKTTGQHPGGMVVVPADMDIHDFCPIHRPADKSDSDIITTHFDYSKMKGTLLKFDILGHDDPTVLKMLGDLTGVDVIKIPLDDQKVMSLFSGTEALGYQEEYLQGECFIDKVGTYAIPEFGTAFVRQMLLDTKPTTFSELIRISGLSHGTNVWLNNAQDLVRDGVASLKEVICTRDDIMVNLIHMGMKSKDAFDIMEFTRKGKFSKHQEYIPVMEENNVPQWYIDSCLKISYMFPKAHAAAYVTMAFRIAWFKVYYPEAFYQAYYTVRADLFDSTIMTKGIERTREEMRKLMHSDEKLSVKDQNVLTILEVVNEMYTRGFKFVPVDLYQSDATKFLKTDEGILPPLSSLAGLGENAAKSIAEARKDGEFMSIEDLKIRGSVNKTALEVLRQEGCLDGMTESAQMSFF